MNAPRFVYHLAEFANWKSIQQYGLLSASQLLDLSHIQGDERDKLERQQRGEHTRLHNGVELHDQKPMPPKALESCLVDLSPSDWYATINARVFFWFEIDRLNRHRNACEPRPQIVLTFDSDRLIAACGDRLFVTPINTGNARRRPAKRGLATFVPYHLWLTEGWRSESMGLGINERKRHHPPAELTILDGVPDFRSFLVDTCELASGELLISK